MIALVFISSCIFNFAVVIFLLRPTRDEKAIDRRLMVVKSREGTVAEDAEGTELFLKTVKRGSFGWLEDLAVSSGITRKIRVLIVQSESATSVGNVLMRCVAATGVVNVATYYFTGSEFIAAPVGMAAGYLPIAMLSLKRSRRLAAFNKALPDCIDMIARSLRAGHSLVAAIAIVAEQAIEPAKTEFNEVYKQQNYGLPFREALMQLLERVPSQDLRVLVTGILVQKDTGGNLAEILDRILHVIKERVRIQGEIRIHTAQGRMTGYILCALPMVMLALINIVNPGYSNVLFTDPMGKKMLDAGIGLLVVGGVIIRKIVNGIEV